VFVPNTSDVSMAQRPPTTSEHQSPTFDKRGR
jgi:hypothetical protein